MSRKNLLIIGVILVVLGVVFYYIYTNPPSTSGNTGNGNTGNNAGNGNGNNAGNGTGNNAGNGTGNNAGNGTGNNAGNGTGNNTGGNTGNNTGGNAGNNTETYARFENLRCDPSANIRNFSLRRLYQTYTPIIDGQKRDNFITTCKDICTQLGDSCTGFSFEGAKCIMWATNISTLTDYCSATSSGTNEQYVKTV
jgi:hypothetical protein